MTQKLQTLFNKTADSLFTKKDLESLYECEYKLFELSKRDYLGDSALSLQGKLLNRLRYLISKGITALKSALEFWLNRHKEITENMLKNLEHTADIYMEEEKYSEMGREAVLDMLKQKALLHKDKDPVFINTSKLYNEIRDFPTGDLNEDRAAFQKALITSHNSGKLLDYIPKSENYRDYITKSLLDELSSGEKYIDRWNAELLKVSKRKQYVKNINNK